MNEQYNGLRNDLLAPEEEEALARLREIVGHLRSGEGTVDVAAMENAIRAEGGKRVHSPEPGGADTFVFRNACFSLRPSQAAPGKIEVMFLQILQ